MFVERHGGGECLAAVGAADLLTAVGVHSLVSTEIGELCVCFAADVAAERLHAAVDVLMLFQSARRREVLLTLRTGVRPLLTSKPLNRRFAVDGGCRCQSGDDWVEERLRATVQPDAGSSFVVWNYATVDEGRVTWRECGAIWRRVGTVH